MDMKVWYLDHSGFAVQTKNHFLIFDYYRDTPTGASLDDGVVSPNEISDHDVIVFVSHSHPDHFSPTIFSWKDKIPKIRYVLSSDVKSKSKSISLSANETFIDNDIKIETLKSTDEGLAFIIDVDGKKIYHSGDLHWWHWDDESEKNNILMASRYQTQINKLKDYHFDLAFIPVDPRQEHNYLLGLNYFIEVAKVDHIVPMHFWGDFQIFKNLASNPFTDLYRDKVWMFSKRGESIEFD